MIQLRSACPAMRPALGWVLAFGLVAAVAGCKEQPKQAAAAPAPQVTVVTLHARPVSLTTDLPGRTSPYRVAEIRPQVSGVILKRLFVEGDNVTAGQLLYQIDPAPYQAALASAQAAVLKAQAAVRTAQTTVGRYPPAFRRRGDQPPGPRFRGRHAAAGPGRRRLRPGAGADRQHQPRLYPRHRADRRQDQPLLGDRRRPGHRQPDPAAGDGDPAQPDLCRHRAAQSHPVEAEAGTGQRPAQDGWRRPGRGQADPGGRLHLRSAGQAAVLRGDGGPGHRGGHAARHLPQRCRPVAAGHVRARPDRGGRAPGRPSRPAAGGDAQPARRAHRSGGGCRQQGGAARDQDRPRDRHGLAGHRRAEGRRPGDRGGRAEGEAGRGGGGQGGGSEPGRSWHAGPRQAVRQASLLQASLL